MEIEEFGEFVKNGRWTFAKSMPGVPHEYVVADWSEYRYNDKALEAAKLIRDNGVRAQWPARGKGKYVNAYLQHTDDNGDTWSYWVMWPIINRAKHPLVPQNEVKVLDEDDSRRVRTWIPQ